MTVKRPTALLTLHLVFTHTRRKTNILNMMPAEPGALIKYTRTQICTFCQSGGGFPTETRGWVSQNLNLKCSNEMKNLSRTLNQCVLYNNQPLTADKSCLSSLKITFL